MRRAEPIRIETMPMRETDEEGHLLREGTRHLIYRGPLRIGEIEETIAVQDRPHPELGDLPNISLRLHPRSAESAAFRFRGICSRSYGRGGRRRSDFSPRITLGEEE